MLQKPVQTWSAYEKYSVRMWVGNILITDRVNTGVNAIASVRPTVRPFPLLNRVTFNFDLLHKYGI